MQSPFNSSGQPPLPDPHGEPSSPQSVPGIVPGDWATAPKIIKGWAWQLAILGSIVLPFFIYFSAARNGGSVWGIFTLINIVAWFIDLFMVYGLRQGLSVAWFVQIVVSALGLTNCPLGTLLHGYLLSQWFKPEVKAWFGVR